MAPEILFRLEMLAGDVAALRSKLILLVGSPRAGKTALLYSNGTRTASELSRFGQENCEMTAKLVG
ncbi:hypothetical protein ACCAA_1230002 [Candidatus Accumulibacter aalborgensis]|uniref:Uncharacterized protein n=1 Tax=Candidatus Accumulibacter aalborgensis TaxID=1860102 RepID=A0A1A8XFL3_9PROT|nr:hypothetical protein ACCAA_1230002 [Candidatus Accumulibacter aalborgensis]